MTNIGGAEKDVPFFGLMVQDDQDDTYSADTAATGAIQFYEAEQTMTDVQLVAGEEQDIILVYDVPIGSTSYRLTDPARTFSLPITMP
jgi:hypothetical protein